MLILVISCLFLVYSPNVNTKAESEVVSLPLTFHGYSIVLRDANNSFCVYDGADGAGPRLANAIAVNLESQITGGQRYGFNYYTAVMMWVIQLPMDLHVKGTVNVRAYISSNYQGSILGGGYGMGLVDIDENNVEVKEFITEADYTYGNPFTSTPKQYSLNTNVDYVFVKGHSIGFAVGLGATTKGFSATVYFDSTDRNSGATLPIVNATENKTFNIDLNGTTQTVSTTSTTAISNLQFDAPTQTLQFLAQGINYTTGYSTVFVPKVLMQTPFAIIHNSKLITPAVTENSTHYQLDFRHIIDSNKIQIIGNASQINLPPEETPDGSNPPTTTDPNASTFNLELLALIIIPILAIVLAVVLIFRKGIFKKTK